MFKIFILGPYRSIDGSSRDMNLLQHVRTHMRNFGWDAILAIDDPEGRSPYEKTLKLATDSDALFFVFTRSGRLEGVASELTALQIKDPPGATRRVAFLEEGLPLSSILDADQHGIFASPPIGVVPFEDRKSLVAAMTAYAKLISHFGGLR